MADPGAAGARDRAAAELRLDRARRCPGARERLRVVSGSMEPTIHQGEEVEVVLLSPARVRFADLVVYLNADGRAVVHRVLGQRTAEEACLLECGDAGWQVGVVPRHRLIGCVAAVHALSGSFPLTSGLARLLSVLNGLAVGGSIYCANRCAPLRRPLGALRRRWLRLSRGLLGALCRTPDAAPRPRPEGRAGNPRLPRAR